MPSALLLFFLESVMPSKYSHLTEEILAAYEAGEEIADLAVRYGGTRGGIYDLIRRNRVATRGHSKAVQDGEVERVVKLYNSGMSPSKVAKEVGCSQETARRVLRKAGIDLTERVRQRNTLNGKEGEVVRLFHEGCCVDEIVRRLDSYTNNVMKVLKKNGCQPLGRKYAINEDFFSVIDSETKAFSLGFLQADGCNDGKFSWQVFVKDVDIIEKMKVALDYAGPVIKKLRTPPNADVYGIYIGSKHMCQDLDRYGCVKRKSYHGWLPPYELISKDLFRHYMRGLFDGDGGFSRSGRKGGQIIRMSLTNNKSVCDSFNRIVQELTGLQGRVRIAKVGPNHTTYSWGMAGLATMKTFSTWLYEGSTIYLDRKYAQHLELMNTQYKRQPRGVSKV